MIMNLQDLLQDFNPSKFVVYTCLLIFTILFALRLDNHILWSYWCVFTPIWVWKSLVILGAAVGNYVWWRYPHFRLEGEAYIHYKSMLISLALHWILLMFELLVCDKLESGRHLWILVFIPLIFISKVSIAVCIWAAKHDRSFELELFCAVNGLQFIFLALRLDGFIVWSWEVVFVPLWIVMCLSLVGVLYSVIFAAVLWRTPEVNRQQRRASFRSAVYYTFLVVPILVFQVMLADKLDDELDVSYTAVSSPLCISFMALILMSFSAKGGNRWWFGMRKDCCSFLMGACPLLQEYANIAYAPSANRNHTSSSSGRGRDQSQPQQEIIIVGEERENRRRRGRRRGLQVEDVTAGDFDDSEREASANEVDAIRSRPYRYVDVEEEAGRMDEEKDGLGRPVYSVKRADLLKPIVPIVSIDTPD